jgi:NADH-quinone oxidoreductase subunit G
LAQSFKKAAHPPAESRTEGQVYADLMGRRGLLQAGPVRAELAAAVPALAALSEKMPPLGTRLELQLVK